MLKTIRTNQIFVRINVALMLVYCRQLGLAFVIGSTSGIFLKAHHVIGIAPMATLLIIGGIFSYIGLCEKRRHYD